MQATFKFDIGQELKDIVTGYTGVVMVRSQYATGCNHYGLGQRNIPKDGKLPEWEFFDETRLNPTGKKGVIFPFFENPETKPTSGIFQNPKQTTKGETK